MFYYFRYYIIFCFLKSGGITIKKEIKNIILCAFTADICFILSFITIFKMPFGGSVTLAHTLPLIFLSFFKGYKSGGKAALIFSFMKIIFSFHIPPSKNIYSYLLVILLDYFIPYFLIGIVSCYSRFFKTEKNNMLFGIIISESLRLVSSIISGFIIWNGYFNFSAEILCYSVIYNLSYMVPNLIISLVAFGMVYKPIKKTVEDFNHTF